MAVCVCVGIEPPTSGLLVRSLHSLPFESWRAAAGFSHPRETKNGSGSIRVYLQRAPKMQARGFRFTPTLKVLWGQERNGRGRPARVWPGIHLYSTGRRPDVDNAPGYECLAVRIAKTIYQGIDLAALVLRNFGIEPSKRANAAGQQRACNNHKRLHADAPPAGRQPIRPRES
jgi:hypothetical protein